VYDRVTGRYTHGILVIEDGGITPQEAPGELQLAAIDMGEDTLAVCTDGISTVVVSCKEHYVHYVQYT